MIANQTARKPRSAANTTKRARYVNLTAVRWAQEQTPGATLSSTLIAVAGFANKAGQCWPSQATIADLTSQTDRTVRAKMRKLEALGFITVTYRYDREGKRASSLIQINWNIGNGPKATTGKNEGDYRKTCSDEEEGINKETTDQMGDFEAGPEPNNTSPDQPIEQQAGRVETMDRPCANPALIPPREVIDAKAVEFIDRAYPWHHTFTDRDRAEGASAFLQAVMRGNEPDLIIWATFYYRAKMQREQGRRPELPMWWIRKQRWTDQPGGDYFMASASDPKERKRMMAVAEAQSWMR